MSDPTYIIKAQLGELLFNNAALASEVDKLKAEIAELKKEQTDD